MASAAAETLAESCFRVLLTHCTGKDESTFPDELQACLLLPESLEAVAQSLDLTDVRTRRMVAHIRRAALLSRLACVSTGARRACEEALRAKPSLEFVPECGLENRAAAKSLLYCLASMQAKARAGGVPPAVAEATLDALSDKKCPFPGCFSADCWPHLERFAEEEEEEEEEEVTGDKLPLKCWKVLCEAPQCSTAICLYHGWGDGQNEGDGYGVHQLSYDRRCCHASVNRTEGFPDGCNAHFCEEHLYTLTAVCDVCTKLLHADAAQGKYNRRYDAHYCQKHPVSVCTRILSQLSEREKSRISLLEYDDTQQCGMTCCPNCLRNHYCGYDPNDFI